MSFPRLLVRVMHDIAGVQTAKNLLVNHDIALCLKKLYFAYISPSRRKFKCRSRIFTKALTGRIYRVLCSNAPREIFCAKFKSYRRYIYTDYLHVYLLHVWQNNEPTSLLTTVIGSPSLRYVKKEAVSGRTISRFSWCVHLLFVSFMNSSCSIYSLSGLKTQDIHRTQPR